MSTGWLGFISALSLTSSATLTNYLVPPKWQRSSVEQNVDEMEASVILRYSDYYKSSFCKW